MRKLDLVVVSCAVIVTAFGHSSAVYADVITAKKDLAGKCFDWAGYGKSRFGANGAYTFEYANGASDKGHWTISKDGTVSIKFNNGQSREDKFDVNGSSVFDSGPRGGSGTLCN